MALSIIRILGIAPYEGMALIMKRVVEEFDNVQMDVCIGDLEAGADIVREKASIPYDVILSRGGTAELIRKATNIPVVDIPLTIFDILRAIRLADVGTQRCAIVGFPAITRNARHIADMIEAQLEICTIHNEAEALTTLQRLAKESAPIVLCDMITNRLAYQCGLRVLLITSGSESIEAALEQAISIGLAFHRTREENLLMSSVLDRELPNTVIMDRQLELIHRPSTVALTPLMTETMKGMYPLVIRESTVQQTFDEAGASFTLTGQRIGTEEAGCVMYTAERSREARSRSLQGIRYQNSDEVDDSFFRSFYGITRTLFDAVDETELPKGVPLMIVGAEGTGKHQLARFIHNRSAYRQAPFYIIDASMTEEEGWNYLFNDPASPLRMTGSTIQIRNLHFLTVRQVFKLCGVLRDTGCLHGNQLIFTAKPGIDGSLGESFRHISSVFGCQIITLPELRALSHQIPELISLYISHLNMELACEISGIEQVAVELLTAYEWPHNYDQFKRVIRSLVINCKTDMIPASAVRQALEQERRLFSAAQDSLTASVLKRATMEEIERAAVVQALKDNDGNQTLAASQLKISRTTLWRILKSMDA